MLNPIESAMTLYDAQLRASKELINALLSGAQRIDRAILQTCKEELDSQLSYAQAFAGTTDFGSGAAMRGSFEQPNRERALACYREMFDAMSEAMLASTRVFDQYVRDLGQCAAGTAIEPMGGTQAAPNAVAVDPFEFWSAGWKQWNSLAEQCREAITAAMESREEESDTAAARKTSGSTPGRRH